MWSETLNLIFCSLRFQAGGFDLEWGRDVVMKPGARGGASLEWGCMDGWCRWVMGGCLCFCESFVCLLV